MLAGTVYIYDENEVLIEELDISIYEDMSKDEFLNYLDKQKASKAVLGAIYHGCQKSETLETLWQKD